jgi:protein SCO1/2
VTRDFSFVNQDNEVVTPAVFQDKVYVTDFFFTTCPSICPIMTRQMTRVYEAVIDEPGVLLLSHTIDPEHDTVEVLKNYADGLGIKTAKWHLVTGSQDEIFAMAKHYMLAAMKHEEAPGGYLHSGSFVLVDRQRQIRGYYDGTDSEAVDRLIEDLALFREP